MKIIRHITVILILLFSHILWAKNNTSIELLSGFYKAAECDIGIFINNTKGKLSYQLMGKEKKTKGEIVLEDNGIQFDSLYSTFYGKNNDGERAYQVGGLIEDNKTFIIQNYGNSMNPYIVFDACGKYLEYKYKPSFETFITRKAYLYKSPNIKTKMYLIKGDKVTLLDEKIDDSDQKWYFINYKGKKDLSLWVKEEVIDKTSAFYILELEDYLETDLLFTLVFKNKSGNTVPYKNAELSIELNDVHDVKYYQYLYKVDFSGPEDLLDDNYINYSSDHGYVLPHQDTNISFFPRSLKDGKYTLRAVLSHPEIGKIYSNLIKIQLPFLVKKEGVDTQTKKEAKPEPAKKPAPVTKIPTSKPAKIAQVAITTRHQKMQKS